MQIRLAGPEHTSAIAAVLLQAFVEYRALYTEQGFATTTPTSREVLARLNEGPIWIAVLEGEIVGTASAILKFESLYIRGMAVLPLARGKRVGKLLLERIEHYASENNCTRLFLSTTPFLDRAIRLYEGCGFRRTDEGPHDLFGTPLFTMEKCIAKQPAKVVNNADQNQPTND
jgi:GNAT superfamily N-acetyltransferase